MNQVTLAPTPRRGHASGWPDPGFGLEPRGFLFPQLGYCVTSGLPTKGQVSVLSALELPGMPGESISPFAEKCKRLCQSLIAARSKRRWRAGHGNPPIGGGACTAGCRSNTGHSMDRRPATERVARSETGHSMVNMVSMVSAYKGGELGVRMVTRFLQVLRAIWPTGTALASVCIFRRSLLTWGREKGGAGPVRHSPGLCPLLIESLPCKTVEGREWTHRKECG